MERASSKVTVDAMLLKNKKKLQNFDPEKQKLLTNTIINDRADFNRYTLFWFDSRRREREKVSWKRRWKNAGQCGGSRRRVNRIFSINDKTRQKSGEDLMDEGHVSNS